MISSRYFRFVPLVLFLVALAIRLVGLNWGLPTSERFYSYHPDERQMLGAIVNVLGGGLNPHFFNYPSLFIYMAAIAHFIALGFSSPSGNSLWAISHDILLHARFVSALLGALTVPVVFSLGREIGGAKIGIVAALLLCFAPAHVQHSHFATVDVAATFWIALSLWLTTRALNLSGTNAKNALTKNILATDATENKASAAKVSAAKSSKSNAATTKAATTSIDNDSNDGEVTQDRSRQVVKSLLLSALCAGLGAATKYNAIFVLIAPVAACFLIEYSIDTQSSRAVTSNNANANNVSHQSGFLKRIGLALGVFATAIFGFLVGCPFSVLSFGEFWGDGKNVGVAYELLVHPRQGSGNIFTNTGNGWWYHATFNLPFALTAPIAIAAGCGLFLVLEGMAKSRKSGIGNYGVLVPMVAFALFYFFALGFSQVRFLRYILPLLPALAIFAALFIRALVSALRINNSIGKFAIAAAFSLISIIGTFNVLWPLGQIDARDAAKHWLDNQNEATPIVVGLADAQNPLWFYTPPFWPQDVPPGAPISWRDAQKNSRYDLQAIGLDAQALEKNRPRYFVWSEFQWRESERLNDIDAIRLRQKLNIEYSMRAFHNDVPLQLPGRAFAPHDFLYTNPRVEVWTRK